MKISVFGLGYVGSVCSGCFADDGHQITGVDIKDSKIDAINNGFAPLYEPGLDDLISKGVKAGKLHAIKDVRQAVLETDISFICVGTPSQPNGAINLDIIRDVLIDIGKALREKDSFHVVTMRSTVIPGTGQNIAITLLEAYSGKIVGKDFGYVSNPEFLRESTAIKDFFHPPKTVLGVSDERSGELISALYHKIDAPLEITDIPVAEMVKYADNAWHATKVVFGNEIGSLAKGMGIDGQEVMRIFCLDTVLNLSPYYLKPGFAFGGSCLPKDVRAINALAEELQIRTPCLSSLMKSNFYQIDRAIGLVYETGKKKIAVLGISFKADTDDTRESPLLTLAEKLLGKGFEIKVYDKAVADSIRERSEQTGLDIHLQHILPYMSDDLDEVVSKAEVVIIGNASKEFSDIKKNIRADQHLIDLIRVSDQLSEGHYQGICW